LILKNRALPLYPTKPLLGKTFLLLAKMRGRARRFYYATGVRNVERWSNTIGMPLALVPCKVD
jgi:hypothetical protein